jgi:hypothetical protein
LNPIIINEALSQIDKRIVIPAALGFTGTNMKSDRGTLGIPPQSRELMALTEHEVVVRINFERAYGIFNSQDPTQGGHLGDFVFVTSAVIGG